MNWTDSDTWIVITAILCSIACALPGTFLVLRKMSMMGDAISHAVLPGLALAFLITESRASLGMFVAAIITGLLTALFTQWITKFGQVDQGASMGIVFTTLFAIGLILIVQAADHVDLDADCVLYGAIELTPLDTVTLGSYEIPRAALSIGSVLLLNALLITLCFKEFRLSSFDPNLCNTLGISAQAMHYLLMAMVALTTVACFESTGSIIVIAMLIAPAATAHLITQRLLPLLLVASLFGTLSAISGHILALSLPHLFQIGEITTSGMIAVCAGILFLFVWSSCILRERFSRPKLPTYRPVLEKTTNL